MKIIKRTGWILLVILVLIQFIHPAKNIQAGVQPNHITTAYPATAAVTDILQKACYDCHSNNTVYPWYANIQPVAWWLNHHVVEGKRELNFSEFMQYRIRKQYKKLDECIDEINEGEMPLSSYTLIHKNAVLSKEQKQTLINWLEGIRQQIAATNPPDSLIIPKKHT
ncbi:MAG: heme-binding domain-containing protein [Chitinophaga sp.]|uniref:heme-binding domain-containing protein n=1 Tax=Chitinophaga sp. TaxID=1869181 RepID=UPI001B29B364|nr:heme-binding domain-containing protein [Chitinophaga sp.]MBO9730217.1 heme-binding domain-containing protein [Chitinophaga sp.]